MDKQLIQPHNAKAAATWGSGGQLYDKVSYSISDGIEHSIIRLAPNYGEQVLDVATGTGWAARRIAEMGVSVTGIDLGTDLINAAKYFSAKEGLKINFQIGDAEKLLFDDKSFDAVISTFGVMFVSNPEAAAKELGRVCKKRGKLALTTWTPDSTIANLFNVMKPYMVAPAVPPPSPFEWGSKERVEELLGDEFELKFEKGTTILREPDGLAVWELFVNGYGPAKALAASLDLEKRENLKRDFIDFHEQYINELGVAMPREYLVTIGTRK